MPIAASSTEESSVFAAAAEDLQKAYPEVREEIDKLQELLRCGYVLPQIPIQPDTFPNVYAVRMDYPPLGERGVALFLVTYHATSPAPSLTVPYQTITMLTIQKRAGRAG